MDTILIFFVLVTAGLIFAVVSQRRLLRRRAGKAVAFVALFVMPLLITALGLNAHLSHAKSTEFCISCHVMEPYGTSLHYEDLDYLPAMHYQNNLVDREYACYTCHTQYTMFGDVKSKLGGLKHVWVYYTGQTPEEIELYQPYNNRECLHCHGGSRSWLEGETHQGMHEDMRTGELSCLECHTFVHDAENADDHETWEASHE